MQDHPLRRRIRRSTLVAAIAALVAVPAAQACREPGRLACPPNGAEAPRPKPTRVIVAAGSDGFDWDDAGIGAAGVLGTAFVLGGCALKLKRA